MKDARVIRLGIGRAFALAISAAIIVSAFVYDASAESNAQVAAVRWENNAGTGQTVEEYAASHPCIIGIFRWDADTQSWRRWYNHVPDYVNDLNKLSTLHTALGYWFAFDVSCLIGDE